MDTAHTLSQPRGETHSTPNVEGRLARRVRLVFLWVVVAAACLVAYRLGDLYAEWRHVAGQRPTRQSMTTTESAMAAAMMPLVGMWSFDDLDWNIQSTTLGHAEVVSHLDTFANSDGGSSPQQLPDVSPKFFQLARDLQIVPVARAGNQVYAINQPEMKGQLVTRDVAGQAKVISLAAAVPQDEDQWQFFELSPRATGEVTNHKAAHLLLLPSGAQRSGGRFGDQGELLLEMIALDSNSDQLLGSWRDAGWDVHETGLGDGDAFSYLCVRGHDTIYVWSADEKNSLHTLMLVRSPGPVDTKVQPQ